MTRLWSYKDPLIQPMQRVRDQQERERGYRAVVHLADRKFVQLATPDLPIFSRYLYGAAYFQNYLSERYGVDVMRQIWFAHRTRSAPGGAQSKTERDTAGAALRSLRACPDHARPSYGLA